MATLVDNRWVWHFELHGNFSAVLVKRRYGYGARTQDFLQRVFGDNGRGVVRSGRPLLLLSVLGIVGAKLDRNLGKIGYSGKNLFWLDVNDF